MVDTIHCGTLSFFTQNGNLPFETSKKRPLFLVKASSPFFWVAGPPDLNFTRKYPFSFLSLGQGKGEFSSSVMPAAGTELIS